MKVSSILLILLASGAPAAAFARLPVSNSNVLKTSSARTRATFPVQHSTAITADDASSSPPTAAIAPAGGQATISSSTFNLAKNIIGAGVLSLPSGVAFLADEPSALLPSMILCAVFGAVSAYSFSVIGKVCSDTDASSFKEGWDRTLGAKSSWLVSITIMSVTFSAALAYSIILGDSFSALFQSFGFPAIISGRTNTILLLSTLVLLPLCSLKSLNSLAPFSILGLGGTLLAALFMLLRFKDGSYFEGGKYFADIVMKPSFGQRGGYKLLSSKIFILLSMLSTSFVAHFNAPTFFRELKNPTMSRFNRVVYTAFGAAILFFNFIMATGFLTFGGNSLGFILNNYANTDPLAAVSRIALSIALVTSYPFPFSSMRNTILDMMGKKGSDRDAYFKPITLIGLSSLTALAIALKDVGFVVSVSGALFGCAVLFMIPGLMNVATIKKTSKNMGKSLTRGNKFEIGANIGMIVTGILMAIIGVAVSVLRQLGKM